MNGAGKTSVRGVAAAGLTAALLSSSCGLLGDDTEACDAELPAANDLSGLPPERVGDLIDEFEPDGELAGYTVNNAGALPDVVAANGSYRATVTDNSGDRTLHFNESQGRLDAMLVAFPFEVIASNIGIGTVADTQIAPDPIGDETFIFAGVQIHDLDLDARNSSHLVVGHRGWAPFTIEGKHTCAGVSWVSDEDADAAPTGRIDIRIVGTADHRIEAYHRSPGSSDDWAPYRGDGTIPGAAPEYADRVFVGLITSAQGSLGLPYVGTADRFEILVAGS